jgi:YD repeat-containing protein
MSKYVRRVVILALFLLVSSVLLGPIVSGGAWLTSRAHAPADPTYLPWLEPYHKGGIDFGTGLYVRNDQDLIVSGGQLPLVLQRTYRTIDPASRAFGVGASHNGEWYLRGDGQRFQWAELVLDDGASIRYMRTTWGRSFVNAMFEHTTTPSEFYMSRVGWTGRQWALRWFDGSIALFRACSPRGSDKCTIVELRSPDGLKVEYVRDPDTQLLRTMRSGQAAISLDYDRNDRIVRARGSDGQEVAYDYDAGGRLVRVTEAAVVRNYTYDGRGAMLTIDEPRWRIENSYNQDGRCVRQVTRWASGGISVIDVAYRVSGGRVTSAAASWQDGPKTVYHFNRDGYLESKELDPDSPAPVVIAYFRQAESNFSTGVTIRCYDDRKQLLRTLQGESGEEDEIDEMAARTCTEWSRHTGRAPRPDPRPERATPQSPGRTI